MRSCSRRDALRLGLAVAAAPALASCDNGGARRAAAPSPTPSSPTPTAATASPPPRRPTFAGAPAPGQLYFGASVPYYRSLPAWEVELGTRLALNRSYFLADEPGALVGQCRVDLRRGRLPHVSIKPLGTWADVASGRRDRWLAEMLEGLAGERLPVFLTVHHEPENDAGAFGMTAPDFVAMQTRVIERARVSAPNVTVVPVLQQWTFDPVRTEADPGSWVVPDAEVFGVDVYNPWAPSGDKPWRTFGSKLAEVLPWVEGKPVAIGEYGCRVDPAIPGRAREWLLDAVSYARTHQVVSMAYYHSRLNSDHGGFELKGELEATFAQLLDSSWVVRPA